MTPHSRVRCELIRLAVVPVAMLQLVIPRVAAHAQAAAPATVVGTWRGTSICRPVGKPACHDEIAVYHFRVDSASGADSAARRPADARSAARTERLVWQANKVVNGVEEEMGTMSCTYDRTSGNLRCRMRDWLWSFHATGAGATTTDAALVGTLTNAAGVVWRDVRVTRTSGQP